MSTTLYVLIGAALTSYIIYVATSHDRMVNDSVQEYRYDRSGWLEFIKHAISTSTSKSQVLDCISLILVYGYRFGNKMSPFQLDAEMESLASLINEKMHQLGAVDMSELTVDDLKL